MSNSKHCRKCGQPSGAFNYCREHRRQNAAKDRARRQSSSARAKRLGSGLPAVGYNLTSAASFPVASEAYYLDRAPSAPVSASELSPASTVTRLSKVGA